MKMIFAALLLTTAVSFAEEKVDGLQDEPMTSKTMSPQDSGRKARRFKNKPVGIGDSKQQSVCLKNDKKCQSQERVKTINQNNATVKDNPTDLNNQPKF
jgi:hypothetical protein